MEDSTRTSAYAESDLAPCERAMVERGVSVGAWTEDDIRAARRRLSEWAGDATLPTLLSLLLGSVSTEARQRLLTPQDPEATLQLQGGSGPPPKPGPPPRLGSYAVVRKLGEGTMSTVFEASCLGLRVALKVKQESSPLDRFMLEAEALRRLQHPGIVGMLEQGQDPSSGRWFMALDYVEGTNLYERIKASGPLPPEEAARIVADLSEAVSYAHGRGVLHRDLKPHNVMLSSDGRVRLTDFGIARLDARRGFDRITAQGDMLGSPAYMAPEQVIGKLENIGEHTDVYGLGATLYHLLTGKAPFNHRLQGRVLAAVLNDRAPAPSDLRPTIPAAISAVAERCMEKDRDARYPNAVAVAAALRAALQGAPAAEPEPGAASGAPVLLIVGAALVLVLIGLVVALLAS